MSFLFYLAVISLCCKVALSTNVRTQGSFPFTSVVDILSQNVEFSTFLRIVQREGHIPYLNELENYTLFAPVNSAFIEDEIENSIDIQNYLLHDAVLLSADIDLGVHVISNGVKFPFVLERTEDAVVSINNATVVDPDLSPNFQNATVHGIAKVLPTPFDLKHFLERLEEETGDFHLFNNFTKGASSIASLVTNRTLLIPSDANFRKFYSDIEINYITDVFNSLEKLDGDMEHTWQADRQRFLQNIISEKILGGYMQGSISSENLNSELLDFESNERGSLISVNGSSSSQLSNMVFSRGLAHAFDNLWLLSDVVKFNAEKYLHGLNCSNFVRELYFRNLQHLIQDVNLGNNMTIFIPVVPVNGYDGFSKPSLLYHFAGIELWLEKEFPIITSEISKMFESEYCASNTNLGGNCQRIKVTKNENGYFINENYKILHEQPYQVGKTLIYMVSEDFKLPGDLASSINPFYGCSSSLTFLNELNLLSLPLNSKGYTILLPCFNSWETLELNLEFFQRNASAVNTIMKSMIFDGLLYSDSEPVRFQSRNLLGESVEIKAEQYHDGGKLLLTADSINGNIKIENELDLFFSQGVVHPLKQVYLPRSVSISLKDLIQTTGTTRLIELFEEFKELSAIINNNEPYSLLVPTASSLAGEVLNSTKLIDFLKLHVILGECTSALLHCGSNVSTALGDMLMCRKDAQGNHFLRVSEGSQDEVRILKKGCTSFHDDSCIFLIDRPISLQWLNRNSNKLRLPSSPLAIGLTVESIILLVVISIFLYKKKKATGRQLYTSSDDIGVNTPLLGGSDRREITAPTNANLH